MLPARFATKQKLLLFVDVSSSSGRLDRCPDLATGFLVSSFYERLANPEICFNHERCWPATEMSFRCSPVTFGPGGGFTH